MERSSAPACLALVAAMTAASLAARAEGEPGKPAQVPATPAAPAAQPAAEATTNAAPPVHPFSTIPTRNAFRIQPPPPPPPPVEETPKPPPAPPSNVTLTGFTVWKGRKQVYLQVAAAPGKPADYLTLAEEEAQGDIQVLEIDPRKETVKINNGGQEMTLNFKDNGAKSSAQPPPPAGPSVPSPVATALASNVRQPQPSGGPTVIGRGGVIDNNPGAMGVPGAGVGAQAFPGGVAVPLSSPAFTSTLPGANSGVASGNVTPPSNSITVTGQRLEDTTAVPMIPGQDRIINGRRIPAPPPLPALPTPIPTPGN